MRQGLHFVRQQYFDALKPDEFNKQFREAVQPGVKRGFAAVAGSTAAKVTLEPGILFTGEGDQVELESEYADVPGLDATANGSGSARLDLIYCYYRYIQSSPPPQPSYGVILGTPGTFSLFGYGQNEFQIPIALGLVAAGASVYSAFYPFPRMYRVNHYLVSGKEYVTNGSQTAMRISIIPMAIPSLSVIAGIRVEMVEAGTLADDAEITAWSLPFHLTHEGEINFAALLAEVVAARGSKASLDARLDVSLNEDGTLNFSGALGALLAEVVAARGDMTSLDARLDVALDEDGQLNADTVRGHVAVHPAGWPANAAIVERSINNQDIALLGILNENLADSTIKARKMETAFAGDWLSFSGAGDAMALDVVVPSNGILPVHCGDRVERLLASMSSDSGAAGASGNAIMAEVALDDDGDDESPEYMETNPFDSGTDPYPWQIRKEGTGNYQVRPPGYYMAGVWLPKYDPSLVVFNIATMSHFRTWRALWVSSTSNGYWDLFFADDTGAAADTNFTIVFTRIG